jgi:hypothetical protein
VKRELLIYVSVLSITFLMAYQASLPRATSNSQTVDWLAIAQSDITKIQWIEGRKIIEAKPLDNTTRFLMTEHINIIDEAPTAAGDESKEQVSAKRTPSFVANDRFGSFVSSLDPLKVARVIGDSGAFDLADFGLEGERPVLKVSYGDDDEFALKIGSAQFNSSKIFVEDTRQNKILLVKGQNIQRFNKARSKFFERDLIQTPWREIATAEIVAGKRRKILTHTRNGKSGVKGWSDAEASSKPNSSYKTWLNKIARMKIIEYADQNSGKEITASNPFLEVSFSGDGAVLEKLRFFKVDKNRENYYVWSKSLGVYAKVDSSKMDTVQKDLDSIFGQI